MSQGRRKHSPSPWTPSGGNVPDSRSGRANRTIYTFGVPSGQGICEYQMRPVAELPTGELGTPPYDYVFAPSPGTRR